MSNTSKSLKRNYEFTKDNILEIDKRPRLQRGAFVNAAVEFYIKFGAGNDTINDSYSIDVLASLQSELIKTRESSEDIVDILYFFLEKFLTHYYFYSIKDGVKRHSLDGLDKNSSEYKELVKINQMLQTALKLKRNEIDNLKSGDIK